MRTTTFSVEVITLPVSDVERALRFYVDQVGFMLDVDYSPGSSCSIQIGNGLTDVLTGRPLPATSIEVQPSDSLRGQRINRFDEQYLVALLIVNEIVHLLFRYQKAEAAWSKTLLFANGKVAQGISGRTVDCGVSELFKREALTGVLDAQYDCPTGTDKRNFHIMARVEMPSMLHCVQENFSESRDDGFPICFRNAGIFSSMQELDQAICGFNIAAGRQSDPSGRPREDFDPVVPAGRVYGLTHHIDESRVLEGTRKVTEGTFTHGVKYVPRCELVGKDDKARMRTSGSDFVNHFKVFSASVLRSRNDQVERIGCDRGEGGTIVVDTLHTPVFARENAVEQFIDLGAGINHKRDSLWNRGGNERCTAASCHGGSKKTQVCDRADSLAQDA